MVETTMAEPVEPLRSLHDIENCMRELMIGGRSQRSPNSKVARNEMHLLCSWANQVTCTGFGTGSREPVSSLSWKIVYVDAFFCSMAACNLQIGTGR